MKHIFLFSLLFSCAALWGAQYQIVPEGSTFKILRDGKVLVEKVESPLTFDKTYTFKTDKQTLKDGSQVWNFTSTDKRLNFRMEAALLDKGRSLEITASTTRPAKCTEQKPAPLMAFSINKAFYQGADYEALTNSHSYELKKGTVTTPSAFPRGKFWRWWTLKTPGASVTFDINPIGIGDFGYRYGCGVCRGIAEVRYTNDSFKIIWPYILTQYYSGGMLAVKVRIKDGDISGHDRDHALRSFHYIDAFAPKYLLSFGSKKHGKAYTSGDGKAFDEKRKWGWVSGMPEKTVATASGAYYSHQAGKDGHFRMSGLVDGLYLVTFGAGNPTGTENRFSVTVNGQKLLDNVTVGKDRFLTATLPLWIDNGVCDMKLTGNYIVSSIASQFLLSNREDFSCRRGFWVTDGYEPSALFNNNNYKPYAHVFKPSVKEAYLPSHGKEMAAPYHRFAAKRIDWKFDDPKNYWLFNARIGRIGSNSSSLEEMEDPKVMESVLDDELKKGKNTLMFSGMHSRHTYPKSEERCMKYFRQFTEMAHKKGIRVIHHHDTTLLWNMEAGFRVLAEDLDNVTRSIATQLPGFSYCILAPGFKKMCMDYMRKLVAAGFDGLQIDELNYIMHAGSCPACREEFHKDTGWYLPVDETHPCYNRHDHPIYWAFSEWKQEKATEWKTNIHEQTSDLNPYVMMPSYGPMALSLSPWGLWLWNSNIMKGGRIAALMGNECQNPNALANARMAVTSQKFYNFFRFADGIPVFSWLSTEDWKSSYFMFCTCLMNAQLPLDFAGGFEHRSEGFMECESFEANPDAMNRRVCRDMAKTGVLYSLHTVWNDLNVSTPAGSFGFAQTLDEMHIPYIFLSDETILPEYLKEFNVLYLGSSSCLSDQQIAAVMDFAEKGGTVLMSGRVGAFDAYGQWRKVWPFEKLMGFKIRPELLKVKSVSNGKDTVVPAGGTLVVPKMIPVPQEKGLYSVNLQSGETIPGLMERKYGKGRFLYASTRIEELFYAVQVSPGQAGKFNYDEKLADFYQNLLKEKIAGASPLQTDAPKKIFMTLYRENDQILVHLLNGLATGVKKGEVVTAKFKGEPFPPLQKDIILTVPFIGKNEVFAVSPDFTGHKKLNAVYHDNGTVTVILPKELLKGYTLIRIR